MLKMLSYPDSVQSANRSHNARHWESQPADDITLKSLDRSEVVRIVDMGRSIGRVTDLLGQNLPATLDALGVRHQGKVLRAAAVLFGKTFLPDYPQCALRMARFRGHDTTEVFERREVRGPAFKLLEEAELFCQRHLPLPEWIEPARPQRVELPLIPPRAMREIFVNALIHRDYSIADGVVSLAIFNNRVEVQSTGSFPSGITPESLIQAHASVLPNPIIAEAFNRAGLVEKWGRGTLQVIAACRAAGLAKPEFEESTGNVVVTFRVRLKQTVGGASPRLV